MNKQISSKALNEKSVELLPAYFILAEANIGMGGTKLKKAEEFLIAANWNLLKSNQNDDQKGGNEESLVTKEEIDRYTASLNITFGRLFMAQSRKDGPQKALEKLTQGIYQECQEHGPESVYLCRSYFYLGQLFQQMGQNSNAKAFFTKIVQIWRNFIIDNDLSMHMMNYQIQEIPQIYYDEADKHLDMILNWFRQEFGEYDNSTAECLFSHSLIQLKRGNADAALKGMQDAYNEYRNNLGDYDPKTKQVEDVIQKVEEALQRQD